MNPQKENKKKNEKNPVFIISGKPTLAKHHQYLLTMMEKMNGMVSNISFLMVSLHRLKEDSDVRLKALELKNYEKE